MVVIVPTLAALRSVPKPGAVYPVEVISGIEGVRLPGGYFIMGGGKGDSSNAPAHWASVGPLWIARRPAMQKDFGPFAGRKAEKVKGGYPIINLTAPQVDECIAKFNDANKTRFGLPSEAAWEYAARGEVVNLRDVMEEEKIAEKDFVERLGDRVENLFAHCLGSHIYSDPKSSAFQRVLSSAAPIYGYWVFGHSEGLRKDGKIWFNKGCIADATGEEAEKRVSSYNLIDMLGNVWEFVADCYDENAYLGESPIDRVILKGTSRVCRGGSGFNGNTDLVRPAYRLDGGLDLYNGDLGFRVAL